MESKLPEALVAELVEEGMGPREIAAYLWEHRGTKVTPQAISVWKKRRGYPVRAMVHGWSPWEVAEEHRAAEPYRVLRLDARRRAGLPLSDSDARRLEAAEEYLTANGDLVFAYEPDRPGGPWFTVPRRPGVDEGLARRPA